MSAYENVAMIGAGTMGHALALVHALGGTSVRLYDNDPDRLQSATALIASALDTMIEAGAESVEHHGDVMRRITTAHSIAAAVEPADLVVEAVVENADVKRRVFQQIDDAARPDAVIASNTSHLDVFPLIPKRRQPLAAIAHWYTPPYIIDLVDIAPGPETNAAVVPALAAFYRGMGKRPVVFDRLVTGYIANRLQAAISLEVADLLDRGIATPEMIDESVRYGLSLRMVTLGHLKKQDFTGLDMAQRALANATYRPPEPRGRCDMLDKIVAEGRTGVSAGAGFYDYGGQSAAALLKARDLDLLRLKALQNEIDQQEQT